MLILTEGVTAQNEAYRDLVEEMVPAAINELMTGDGEFGELIIGSIAEYEYSVPTPRVDGETLCQLYDNILLELLNFSGGDINWWRDLYEKRLLAPVDCEIRDGCARINLESIAAVSE